jgi:hypothetical protein
MASTLRWFAVTTPRGLYVVEYRSLGGPFAIWTKWIRGFWELRLSGQPEGFFATYMDQYEHRYNPVLGPVPQADLDEFWKGVREGWHAPPPQEFFTVRFPVAP